MSAPAVTPVSAGTAERPARHARGRVGHIPGRCLPTEAPCHTRDEVLATVTRVKSQLRRLETLGIPVAAAVNGAALGGGLEIALATHHRVVLDDPKVKLGFLEVTLGLLPGGGGIVRSVRLLGLTTALLELLLQGQQLRPDKALKLGLVHDLAADSAELLAKAPPGCWRTRRRSSPTTPRATGCPAAPRRRRRWRHPCPRSRPTWPSS